jgi:hypothetical protein
MRRDHFTITAKEESGEAPRLVISYDGPTEPFERSLTDDTADPYRGDVIDAAFRLREPFDAEGATGAFSLTHRITGEFLLEANADAEDISSLVRGAAERGDEETSYRIHIECNDPVEYEMDSLLVYDEDGNLLRQHSLIPSGVEL